MERDAVRVRAALKQLGATVGGHQRNGFRRWPILGGDGDIVAVHSRSRQCVIAENEGASSGQSGQKLYKAMGQLVMAASGDPILDWTTVFILVVHGEAIARHLSGATALARLNISGLFAGDRSIGRPMAVWTSSPLRPADVGSVGLLLGGKRSLPWSEPRKSPTHPSQRNRGSVTPPDAASAAGDCDRPTFARAVADSRACEQVATLCAAPPSAHGLTLRNIATSTACRSVRWRRRTSRFNAPRRACPSTRVCQQSC